MQVLGKSAKPIPILVIGTLLGGKRYSRTKFLIVLLIVVGVAMFLYKEGHSQSEGNHFNFGYGEMLVVSQHSMYMRTHTHKVWV